MIVLSGSVGLRGQNALPDVEAVTARLVALGFRWADEPDGLVSAIRLFQAIKNGHDIITGVDGRVDPGGATLAWLNAANAPRWQLLTASAVGLSNHDIKIQGGVFGYGTNWLDGTLTAAGSRFQALYRDGRPRAAPITVNDASKARGGPAPPHKGHQTGLVCDLRLPRKDGLAGGIKVTDPQYDRETMAAQLSALKAQALFDRAFLNDAELIKAGLCKPLVGHDDHVHVEIKPLGQLDLPFGT